MGRDVRPETTQMQPRLSERGRKSFKMSGPARIDSHCDHLDDSFLGSNEDLKCFAAKFEAINKEVKA